MSKPDLPFADPDCSTGSEDDDHTDSPHDLSSFLADDTHKSLCHIRHRWQDANDRVVVQVNFAHSTDSHSRSKAFLLPTFGIVRSD